MERLSKLMIVVAVTIMFALSSCTTKTSEKKDGDKEEVKETNKEEEEETEKIDEEDEEETKNVNKNSKLEDFKGKPSIILFGRPSCPHCKSSMPVFKHEIVKKYENKINTWVNVTDFPKTKKLFEIEGILQGYNENLKFKEIVGEKCNSVPSWAVLDKNAKSVMVSCGNDRKIKEAQEKLDELLD